MYMIYILKTSKVEESKRQLELLLPIPRARVPDVNKTETNMNRWISFIKPQLVTRHDNRTTYIDTQ